MEELKKALEESITPLATKMTGIEDRLGKIEALPLMKANFNINHISGEYKGRKLAHQGCIIREAAAKQPGSFAAFKDEQKIDEFCKFMIDVVTQKTTLSSTGANGGYLVPDEYQMDIIQLARNNSYALSVARIFPMGTDTLRVPLELTHGTSSWIAEGSNKSGSEPTFDEAALSAKKMMNLAVAGNEMLEDSAIDIASLLTEQFAYAMGQELDNQMFAGTGSPISGVVTAKAGYSVVLSAGSSFSTVAAPDLSMMISKLAQGRLAGAEFFFNRLGMHYIRSLKDSNSQPIFAPPGGVVPGTLYGFPVRVTHQIANTDGASTAFGVFGNFKLFLIGRRTGAMVIEADPYTKFDYFQTQFRMVTRWAFAYGDLNAFCRILSSA